MDWWQNTKKKLRRYRLMLAGHKRTLELLFSKKAGKLQWKEIRDAFQACEFELDGATSNGVKFLFKGKLVHEIEVKPDPNQTIDNLSLINDICGGFNVTGSPPTDVNQFLNAIGF